MVAGSALYENTTREFQAEPNPWREELLRKEKVPDPMAFLTTRVLAMSDFDFDRSPALATAARAALMRIQRCGDLPGFYRELLAAPARSTERMDEPPRGSEQVEAWRRMIEQHGPRPGCRG